MKGVIILKKVISFPNLGDYYVPIKNFLIKTSKCEVMVPLKSTKHTLELGNKYSPDFVCLPFKYTLGNFIESLDNGANVLVQAGGGCRYGYYAEVQEKILRDLGYKFDYINLTNKGGFSLFKFYKGIKKLNPKLNIFKFSYWLLVAVVNIIYMDKLDKYIRKNISYEKSKGIFMKIKEKFLKNVDNNYSIFKLRKLYKQSIREIKNNLKTSKDETLKIGIVGELFSLMEHSSSYNIEEFLLSKNIEVRRYTDLTCLLITKRFQMKKFHKISRKFAKYLQGADATPNISHSIDMANEHFDGIIHMKPMSCSPEINAVPILQKVSEEYDIPILFLTFDSQYAKGAIDTRIEAFIDMLQMRKENLINEG